MVGPPSPWSRDQEDGAERLDQRIVPRLFAVRAPAPTPLDTSAVVPTASKLVLEAKRRLSGGLAVSPPRTSRSSPSGLLAMAAVGDDMLFKLRWFCCSFGWLP